MNKYDILKVLKDTRKSKGLTLTGVSKALKLHRNTLSRIEIGKCAGVKYDVIRRYADYLELELVLIHKSKL